MASIRNLKKDINYLASELVTEAYIKQLVKEDVNQDALAKLMVEAVDFRNELVARANHPDGKHNVKMVKSFYKKLRKDMFDKFLKLIEKINEL